MTLIVHPDVDQLAVDYFSNTLASQGHAQHVSKKVPTKNRPDRFLRVFSNGGPDVSLIATRAQIVAHLYDIDGPRCAATANLVAGLGKAAVGYLFDGYPHVAEAKKIGGPTDLDDPDVKTHVRYQVVLEWLIRAKH
ncbi:hypothetical protein [Mycobacteroides chelonae]|uniref:hypothetical protein n=1 Tax=Mycobacteroides chelonae TaxID=1774 RepID=UPI0009923E12|nr:hypothetical protein [Mycobacteroides chelonae]